MAGAAAKKTAKNAEVKTKYYAGSALAFSLIHFVIRVSGGMTLGGFFQFAFLTIVAWLSFRMIRAALELGVGFDLWQDLFIINSIVQLGCLWSNYVWLIYLAVPGYGIYMFGGKVLNWVFTPKETDHQPPKADNRRPKHVMRR